MGKNRRRSQSHDSWWKQSTGGVAHWALIAVAVFVVAGAGVVLANLPERSSIEADPAATPQTEFSFGAERPDRTFALFVGDSYSAGTGASTPSARWTTLASGSLSWTETNAALGGTGYIVTSNEDGCGLAYCGTFGEAIADVGNLAPDIVVISGGRNDNTRLGGDQAVVEDTMRAAQARWPEARLVVTSPLWDDDEPPAWLSASADTVRAAAAASGATYLDLGQPLVGHPEYVSADDIHPNDAGHQAIQAAFLSAWANTPQV